MEKGESGIPVTNLDDENATGRTQSVELEFSSPTGLITGHERASNLDFNNASSPALNSSLDESVTDSFVQSDILKIPQLESTRISSGNCAPGDFESEEQDISKVASEFGDSISLLNAGFLKQKNLSADSAGDMASVQDSKLTSMESSSVFVESDSELGLGQDAGQVDEAGVNKNVEANGAADNLKSEEDCGADVCDSVQESEVQKDSNEDGNVEASAALNVTESEEGSNPDFEIVEDDSIQNFSVDSETNSSKTEMHSENSNKSASSDPEVEQSMKLPDTVTHLISKSGVNVYIVGTAHFSHESQEDVAKTILMTRPRVVVVELCVGRLNILRLNEETILEEAKNLNFEKIRATVKQYGAVQGALYLLFLSTSAHLTRQLGMAPGGEFRRAYNEARNVEGCRIHLGDRPIHVTLHRALAALSLWQKIKLVWHLLLNRSPIR